MENVIRWYRVDYSHRKLVDYRKCHGFKVLFLHVRQIDICFSLHHCKCLQKMEMLLFACVVIQGVRTRVVIDMMTNLSCLILPKFRLIVDAALASSFGPLLFPWRRLQLQHLIWIIAIKTLFCIATSQRRLDVWKTLKRTFSWASKSEVSSLTSISTQSNTTLHYEQRIVW